MTPQQIEALNIAGQCRATASSPLAKNILVDEGNGLLTELLLDAARIIEALAQPEQEPGAWPCLIDSADFSENTITLVMQCDDYKLSAGTHWLSTTLPQRTWVGLTDSEIGTIAYNVNPLDGIRQFSRAIEAKLKEKNT